MKPTPRSAHPLTPFSPKVGRDLWAFKMLGPNLNGRPLVDTVSRAEFGSGLRQHLYASRGPSLQRGEGQSRADETQEGL